ncbi:MAG TPA: two-component regulator propeller domain-containing protein, partial [Mucilaginibacter sp.]
MTYFIFLVCYFLLLIPAISFAQHSASKLYSANDGLPSTITKEVYQDRYGYLWISTSEGVSRFDGRQFVNYSVEDGLPSLIISKLYQDSRERLWLGTNAGMAQFKNNKFITYPTADKQYNLYVFNFAETADRKLFALTSKGIYEFADNIWKKKSFFPGFKDSSCRNLLEINGELYINYYQDILCRNRKGKWLQIAQHLFFNEMSLQAGHILVSSEKNVYEIRDHKLARLYKKDIPTETFFSYLVDSRNRFWLAGYNFLKISKPGDWRHFTDSINQYNSYAFVNEDSSHNVWLGTMDGLLKLKDLTFSTLSGKSAALLDGIYNIIPLPGNKFIYSSGTKYGLIIHDDAGNRQLKSPASLKNKNYYRDPVDSYTYDNENTLWMTTRFKRLLRFNGKKLKDLTSLLHLKTTEHIYDISYAKKRNRFFVCADSTLLCGTRSGFSAFIPRNTNTPIVKPTRVIELKNGLLLIYIDGKGVYGIDSTNNLFPLIERTGINGSKKGIQLDICFYEDSNNNFWIGVPGRGIYEYGFAKNKLLFLKNHITTNDGLQSNSIHSVTNDRQNRLWVVTNKGID